VNAPRGRGEGKYVCNLDHFPCTFPCIMILSGRISCASPSLPFLLRMMMSATPHVAAPDATRVALLTMLSERAVCKSIIPDIAVTYGADCEIASADNNRDA
jgi:hypothetical protein